MSPKQFLILGGLSLALVSSCFTAPPFALTTSGWLPPVSSHLSIAKTEPIFQRDSLALIRQFHQELSLRSPELIRLKYQAMAQDPFAFYRATAFLYYHDLRQVSALNSPVQVTLQGDFHLENLGTYRTAQGTYAYDLNDFDESFQGPYTWDLARLAVSVHLAAAQVGFDGKAQEDFVTWFISRYLHHLNQVLANPQLLQVPLDSRFLSEKPAKQVQKAASFQRPEYLAQLAPQGRFRQDPELPPVSASIAQEIQAGLANYAAQRPEGPAFYRVKDLRGRVAGKGSLGRYRYIVLVEGPSPALGDDLVLELKEAILPSSQALNSRRGSQNALRIVQAYRYFLPQADPFLGVTQLQELEFFVRELLPKETVNLEKLNKKSEYEGFLDSVALIIARAHARSGKGQEILKEASSPQDLSQRLGPFAQGYFKQVESDYQRFRQALAQGEF